MQMATQQFLNVWQELFDKGLLVHFQAKHEIVYEGHTPYGVHVFVSGEVTSCCLQAGRRIAFETVPLFMPIGFDLLISGRPYDKTLVAEQDVLAYFFSRTLLNQCFSLSGSFCK